MDWWCYRRRITYTTLSCMILSELSRCLRGRECVLLTWWPARDKNGTMSSACTTQVRWILLWAVCGLQWQRIGPFISWLHVPFCTLSYPSFLLSVFSVIHQGLFDCVQFLFVCMFCPLVVLVWLSISVRWLVGKTHLQNDLWCLTLREVWTYLSSWQKLQRWFCWNSQIVSDTAVNQSQQYLLVDGIVTQSAAFDFVTRLQDLIKQRISLRCSMETIYKVQ